MNEKVKSIVLLLGMWALTPSFSAWAATDVESRQEGSADVRKRLSPGQRTDGSPSTLKVSAFHVIGVNSHKADSIACEIGKKIHAGNVRGKTPQAWPDKDQPIFKDPPEDANRYSDENRARTKQVVAELEALPVDRDKIFYREVLQKRGYEVTAVNADSWEVLNLEAVKNGQSVRFTIHFNNKTGKSTKVGASKLRWEAESTRAARIRGR